MGFCSPIKAQNKTIVRELGPSLVTKFKFEGIWEIYKTDLNIKPRKANFNGEDWLKKEYYIGKQFHFILSEEKVIFKQQKQNILTSVIENYINKQNGVIMRAMTGGFQNYIVNIGPNQATLSMGRASFLLFITNLNIKRSDFSNFNDYENTHTAFYQNLINNYISVNDHMVKFYLKKIN